MLRETCLNDNLKGVFFFPPGLGVNAVYPQINAPHCLCSFISNPLGSGSSWCRMSRKTQLEHTKMCSRSCGLPQSDNIQPKSAQNHQFGDVWRGPERSEISIKIFFQSQKSFFVYRFKNAQKTFWDHLGPSKTFFWCTRRLMTTNCWAEDYHFQRCWTAPKCQKFR